MIYNMEYTREMIAEVVGKFFYDSYEKAKMVMMKRGFSEADAEDAVHDALENMVNVMQKGTESDMNEAYFITAVKNAGIDVKRSSYNRDTVQGDDLHEHKTMEDIDFGDRFLDLGDDEDGIDMILIMDIINTKIKPKHKEAITLVYFKGHTVHEIEALFGINHNTMLARLKRAYDDIRLFYSLYTGMPAGKKEMSDVQKRNRTKRTYKRQHEKDYVARHYGSDKFYNTDTIKR